MITKRRKFRLVVLFSISVLSAFLIGLGLGQLLAAGGTSQSRTSQAGIVVDAPKVNDTPLASLVPAGAEVADFRQVQDVMTLVGGSNPATHPADYRTIIPKRVGMYFDDEREVARLSKAIIDTALLLAEGGFDDWKAELDRQGRGFPKEALSETDARVLWEKGQQLLTGGVLRLDETRVYLRRQRGESAKTPVNYFDNYLFRMECWRSDTERAMFYDMSVTLVDVTISTTFSDASAQTLAQPGRLVFRLAKRPSDGEWIVCEVGLTGVVEQLRGKIPIF